MSLPDLSTTCLLLSPFGADDVAEVTRLFAHEPVYRYICDGEAPAHDVVLAWQRKSDELFRTVGTGLWIARRRSDNAPVALTGFFEFFEPPVLEFFFAVDPAYFRQGFAREFSKAVIDDARTRLGMTRIVASTDAPNAASVAALNALGFVRAGITAKQPHTQWHFVLETQT